jgi:hypothetical protein
MHVRRLASCRSGGTVLSSSSKCARTLAGCQQGGRSHVGRRGGSQSAACGRANATLWEQPPGSARLQPGFGEGGARLEPGVPRKGIAHQLALSMKRSASCTRSSPDMSLGRSVSRIATRFLASAWFWWRRLQRGSASRWNLSINYLAGQITGYLGKSMSGIRLTVDP